ncbi:MAG: sigma-70 family RNA polymerase sigma factor [Actinobacteria bacterium]|nr:MAG: sigma-70 family RNA polymerase sigma factor [Actinomycetota bacterium]
MSDDEYADRLAADRVLYERLADLDFVGSAWDEFAEALIGYALPVCTGWLRSGLIFKLCAERSVPVGPTPTNWTVEDRHELALETVALALARFRSGAQLGRGWDPAGGASLKTFFMGRCIYAFVQVYRNWRRSDTLGGVTLVFDLRELPEGGTGDPADLAIAGEQVRDALDELDPRTRAILILVAEGYSHREIGEILHITPRAVEGAVHRHRRRMERSVP